MMRERDRLKNKAKDLAKRDSDLGIEASDEQKLAWNHFKIVRNMVTNRKNRDEIKYKKEKKSSKEI